MDDPQGKPDVEAILKCPDKFFATPREVVTDGRLTAEDKHRILESWAVDAQLLAVAEEENMGGKDRPGLRDVKLAQLELKELA